MDADQIVVLHDGKIVGLGKHRELLKNCRIYREIAESQLSEEELAMKNRMDKLKEAFVTIKPFIAPYKWGIHSFYDHGGAHLHCPRRRAGI